MTRRQRNYLPHLIAEWQRLFPQRPDKRDFSDEVICAVNVIMRQIEPIIRHLDPDGKMVMIEPPMPAEGYVPQAGVRSKGKQKEAEE